MKSLAKKIVVLLVFSILMYSCEKEDPKKEEEIVSLKAYIETNNITVTPTSSGLYYIETEAGTGEQAVIGKYAKVRYTGTLIDGTVFDTNVDNGKPPLAFMIGRGEVISGWDEGVALMKEGGKATLIVPSEIGYGENDNGTIPAYSTLIFDIELLDVY